MSDNTSLVIKGWGYELIIRNSDLYCGKILHFVKGKSCSLHYHVKKTETFYINAGRFKVLTFKGDAEAKKILSEHGPQFLLEACDTTILSTGDVLHIEPGFVHKMIALEANSELVEFSTKHYDDDSFRLIKGD